MIVLDSAVHARPTDQGFRWSTSAAAVGEFVLWWRTDSSPRRKVDLSLPLNTQIAAYLPVSVAQVSKVLNKFDQEGWTRKTGAEREGREHCECSTMLPASSAAGQRGSRRNVSRRYGRHARIPDPATFYFERLRHALPATSHCLTGWLAADMRAPLSTSIPNLSLYLDPDVFDFGIDDVMDSTGLRRVQSGQRVTFIRAEDQVLTLATKAEPPLASDARIYADLLTAGSRGEQAASHLREVTLDF